MDRDDGAENRFLFSIAALLVIAIIAIVFAASRKDITRRSDDSKLTHTERKSTAEEFENSMREIRETIQQKDGAVQK